jgi:glycosyltransferase involved in cell wall biosynthesis
MPHLVFVQYSSMFGGSTISGCLVTEAMRERGWDVTVVYGFDGPFVETSRALGCQTRVLPHKSWLRTPRLLSFAKHYLQEMRAARGFLDLYKEVQPDVIYINTLVSAAAARAAKQYGAPLIWHIRELYSDVGGEMFVPAGFFGRQFVSRFVRRHACLKIAISRSVAENILGSIDGPELEIVSNAVRDDYFTNTLSVEDARTQLGLPMDVPVVGVPGTLRPMKGHAFLLASAMAIRSRIPNVHIIISGTGQEAYQQELRHLVQQNGLEETVQFLGNIEDMRVFYKACTVACIPSVAEPFGRTVIEAFASRVPVVGSAVGGIKETIQHKENGLLVPYGDTAQLVEALVKVVEDPAFARKIVARARGDAEQLYHERVYKARIGSLIERQCEGRRASIMNKP